MFLAILDFMKEMVGNLPASSRGRSGQRQGEVMCVSDNCAVEVDSKFALKDQYGNIIDKGR